MPRQQAVSSGAAVTSEEPARLPESLASLLRSCASASNAQVPNDIEDPNSSAHAQLLSLTSQSLSELRTQPAALVTAKLALDSQLSTLCSRHVGSFVRVHTATRSLPSALDRLDEQLTMLIENDLPALSQAAQRFPEQIQAPMSARDRARNLLDQYDLSLKDLLDIPRLLMTCARANHPIEALQLGNHMARIARSNASTGHKDTLLKALKQECWVHLRRLREDLLRGLGARGVRLPAARRYVSLLQRLHEVDGASLSEEAAPYKDDAENGKLGISPSCVCLSFLRSRWILVEELGAHETDDDAITLLESQISSWRDIVGDSCTIALALFGDAAAGHGGAQQDELSPLSLIASFGYRAMSKLEQLVMRSLPRLDGSTGSLQSAFETLASLHTQLSYSAASLSRQGLDFSQVSEAREAFETQALHLWSKGLARGVQAFEADMTKGSILSVLNLTGSVDARPLLSVGLEQIQPSSEWSAEAARFPPAATLVNGLLDAHEALLSFAPLSIGQEALKQFDIAVSDCISQSLASFRKVEGDGSATDPEVRLDPLHPTSSSASITDRRRTHEATLAISARLLTAICGSIIVAIRQLLLDTFESKQTMAPALESTMQSALGWCREVDARWQTSEQERRVEAEKREEDRLAAVAAEEARRAAEQEAREEEERFEAERAERARIEEEKRLRVAEAEAAEAAAVEKHRKEEEEALQTKRQQEEETKRQAEEEKRQTLFAEQKRKEEEEERERKRKAAEEEERERKRKAAEEEERRKKDAQVKAEERRQKKQAETEARKKREMAEAEEERKKEEVDAAERKRKAQAEAEKQEKEQAEADELKKEAEAKAEAERKRKEEEDAAEEPKLEQAAEVGWKHDDEAEQKQTKEKQRATHAAAEEEARIGRGEAGEVKQAEEAIDRKGKTDEEREEVEKPSDASVIITTSDSGSTSVQPNVVANKAANNIDKQEGDQGDAAQTSSDAAIDSVKSAEPVASTAASIRASKLAEKLRKRQEDRERAAAAKANASEG